MAAVSSKNLVHTLALALAYPADGSALHRFCQSPLYDRRIGGLVADFLESPLFTRAIVCEFSQIVTRCQEDSETLSQLSPSKRGNRSQVQKILNGGIWYPFEYCKWLKKFGYKKRFEFFVNHGFSFTGYMPPALFLPVENVGKLFGREVCHFVIKEGVLPSHAITALDSEVCLLDCGSSRDVAAYKAMLKLLGPSKFDRIFSASSPCRMRIGVGPTKENPIKKILNILVIKGMEDLRLGDFVRMENVFVYFFKHPTGPGQGHNLLCNDSMAKTFLAFGLNPRGVTKLQVEQFLISEFNKNPEPKDLWAPKVWQRLEEEMPEMDFPDTIDRNEFVEISSFPVLNDPASALEHEKLDRIILRPDNQRIKLLMQARLDQVLPLFKSFSSFR